MENGREDKGEDRLKAVGLKGSRRDVFLNHVRSGTENVMLPSRGESTTEVLHGITH